jgi:hypothetical protein
MKATLRRRFYPETILGVLTGVLFLVTLVNNSWIETLFNIDPDGGNGSVEWMIVGALAVVTVALFSLAGYEWRRAIARAA